MLGVELKDTKSERCLLSKHSIDHEPVHPFGDKKSMRRRFGGAHILREASGSFDQQYMLAQRIRFVDA